MKKPKKKSRNFNISAEHFKEIFKAKYKFHISIVTGICLMLIIISRSFSFLFLDIHRTHHSEQKNQILREFYNISNIFFPICFGFITDYIGYQFVLIGLHVPLILANMFLLVSSKQSSGHEDFSLEFAIVGRILFCLCGEALEIILFGVVMNYFRKSNRISFGLIICFAISNIGLIVVNIMDIFQLYFTYNFSTIIPTQIGLLSSILSFFICIFMVIFEHYWMKFLRLKKNIKDKESFVSQSMPYSFWKTLKLCLNAKTVILSVINGLMGACWQSIVYYYKFLYFIDQIDFINYQIIHEAYAIIMAFMMSISAIYFVGNYIDQYKQKNSLIFIGCLLCSYSYIIFSIFYQYITLDGNDLLMHTYLISGYTSLGIGMGIYYSAFVASIPTHFNERFINIGFGIVCSIKNLCEVIILQFTPNIADKTNIMYGTNPFMMLCYICCLMVIVLEFYEKKNTHENQIKLKDIMKLSEETILKIN